MLIRVQKIDRLLLHHKPPAPCIKIPPPPKLRVVTLIVSACFLSLTAWGQGPFIPPDAFGEPASSSLSFYENQGQLLSTSGQLIPEIKYYSRAALPAVYMADYRVSFLYSAIDTIASTPDSIHRVDMMAFGDASQFSSPQGYESTSDHLNYILPHTASSGGIMEVPGFKRVIYEEFLQDIDLHLYSNQWGLKSYFVIQPGGDPETLQLQFTGLDSFRVSGNILEIIISNHVFTLPIISTYQLDGNGQPQEVQTPTVYHDEDNNVVSFDVGSYDTGEPLIIQIGAPLPPATQANGNLCWSTYHGDDSPDYGNTIKTDADGNIFFAGSTQSPGFPNTPGTVIQTGNNGNTDAFLINFDNNGVLKWGTLFGGSSFEIALDIAFNSSKDVYLTGYTSSNNMPLFPINNSNQEGTENAFILSLNNNGNVWRWSRYIGGNNSTLGRGIAVDSQDNIYMTGWTTSTIKFPLQTRSTAYNQTSIGGGGDGIVVMFDDSHHLLWGTYFGGDQLDNFADIAVGADDRIFLFGSTSSSIPASNNSSNPPCGVPATGDFPDCDPGGNAYIQPFNSDQANTQDAIVVEFDADGQLSWSTYLGGNDLETTMGPGGTIVVDPQNSDNVYLYGYGFSTLGFPFTNPGGGAYFRTAPSSDFLVKFDSRELVWGTSFGCTSITPRGLTIDNSGNIFITGETGCSIPAAPTNYCLPTTGFSEFPICPGNGLFLQEDGIGNPQHNGNSDGYIAAFNSNSQLIWSSFFGGGGFDRPNAITYDDQNDKIFLTGQTSSSGLFPIYDPMTPGTYMQYNLSSPSDDAFLACFEVVSLMTGVENILTIPDHIQLYPNPTQGTVLLEHGFHGNPLITVKVFNSLGQAVHQTQMNSPQISIDLSGLAGGIYYVRLLHNTKAYTLKMIRE